MKDTLLPLAAAVLLAGLPSAADPQIRDSSPLVEKARYLQKDLVDKHWLDGLYVSIVPVPGPGLKLRHTVDEPGNVIHAGVWTGRYLAGVGYQYAVTGDEAARKHGGQILVALRRLQEVTGKPGLLARGYVRGHGPVEDWERDGRDSVEWHQGQGGYADYRWYGDVSVDNFNAVLYGYAIYYDLAADAAQKETIARDTDRLMTHLLDNNCRIVDVDGEVTRYGWIGLDPDPRFDEVYRKRFAPLLARMNMPADAPWRPGLRSSLMLLPDLLIAHHITRNQRYIDFYKRVVERYRDNPDLQRDSRPFSLERVARIDHSSEGQAYEALYNLIRYERDPALLEKYRRWVLDLWEMNWMEGNSLYAFMTAAMLPEYRAPAKPGVSRAALGRFPNGDEGVRRGVETLKLYPVDRVLRPVMNSIRKEIELNPNVPQPGLKLSARPVPINERPHDNEYSWKGNPYSLDGWLKPAVTAFAVSCDDPQVAWFSDSAGRIFMSRDGWKSWADVSAGLMGARVEAIAPSPKRTFVLHARTDKGIYVTRDGGMSWRAGGEADRPVFPDYRPREWQSLNDKIALKIDEEGRLVSGSGGVTSGPAMAGWSIPRASSFFITPRGVLASGPGGVYLSADGRVWAELKFWREEETGAADFLHAYWMGRYYGFVARD